MSSYYIECPHCNMMMELPKNEINCAIYRHGVIKATGKQMDPHAPKHVCDYLLQNNLIYGCGKPFRVIHKSQENIWVEKCEYI